LEENLSQAQSALKAEHEGFVLEQKNTLLVKDQAALKDLKIKELREELNIESVTPHVMSQQEYVVQLGEKEGEGGNNSIEMMQQRVLKMKNIAN
jgi:hypothetical protein